MNEELCEMVRKLSLELMNTGKGDGSYSECYTDEEIIEEFEGMTNAQVVARVTRIEELRAGLLNEVLATGYDVLVGDEY